MSVLLMANPTRNGAAYKWVAGLAVAIVLGLLGAAGGERIATGKADKAARAVIAHKLSLESHPVTLNRVDALEDDIDLVRDVHASDMGLIRDTIRSGFDDMKDAQAEHLKMQQNSNENMWRKLDTIQRSIPNS